jgi:hypothetical protein
MTLGASGGKVQPLSRDELLELARKSPVTNLTMTGRALGVSVPVISRMARGGELEAMGVRVLKCGAQYRIPVADILTVLGIEMPVARLGHGGAGLRGYPEPGRAATVQPPRTLDYRRPA